MNGGRLFMCHAVFTRVPWYRYSDILQEGGMERGTLDEPMSTTIMRDAARVGNKMLCVLNPRTANIQTLKNWDLWGPLIVCLMLATMLSWFAPYEQESLVFALVFVIIWCGAAIVTLNALLLGGNMSFFQSVCVLGYCIFPLNVASIICLVGGHIAWCASSTSTASLVAILNFHLRGALPRLS